MSSCKLSNSFTLSWEFLAKQMAIVGLILLWLEAFGEFALRHFHRNLQYPGL